MTERLYKTNHTHHAKDIQRLTFALVSKKRALTEEEIYDIHSFIEELSQVEITFKGVHK